MIRAAIARTYAACSMALSSPLLEQFARAEPLFEQYGPARPGLPPITLVQTFGYVEVEYAAIRKDGCAGLLDMPHRATVAVRGGDRLSFLNRMLTQELKGVQPYDVRASFWLSRKGRVDADLRVLVLPDRVLLDVDAHAAPGLVQTLGAYVIADDVTIADETDAWHRLSLHGGGGPSALAAVSTQTAGDEVRGLAAGRACVVRVAGHEVVVDRADSAGVPGLELLVPVGAVVDVYHALLGPGGRAALEGEHGARALGGGAPVRPMGWAAWNIARIEAGTPLFYLDFGPESLPAETGVLDERVSFTKGCYLGQEIVARMKSLGHPKRVLCAILMDGASAVPSAGAGSDEENAPQPSTASRVWAAGAEGGAAPAGEPVGTVTSATLSPMLSQRAVCFAQLKWGTHAAGTRVVVEAPGQSTPMRGEVQARLRFV